jgi:hypothetical protein
MYRRLQRFDALQGEAAREFARSAEALDRARDAIRTLQADGGDMTATLAARLNEARIVMNDIDAATARTSAAFAQPAGEEPAEAADDAAPAACAGQDAPATPAQRIRDAARARGRASQAARTAREARVTPPQQGAAVAMPDAAPAPEPCQAAGDPGAEGPAPASAPRTERAAGQKPSGPAPAAASYGPRPALAAGEDGSAAARQPGRTTAGRVPPRSASVQRTGEPATRPGSGVRVVDWSELARAAQSAG